MSWIKTEIQKPKFGELVLVYCRIYGRFLATYERIEDTNFGNWRYESNLGILPPVFWMNIPEIPVEPIDYDNLPF